MGEVFAGPGFRTCSRAGCGWPAVATLSFDYQNSRAWLEDLRPRHDPVTYDLCSVHAERCSSPKGWAWEDRRAMPEPVIYAEPEVENSGASGELKSPAALPLIPANPGQPDPLFESPPEILVPLQATIPEA